MSQTKLILLLLVIVILVAYGGVVGPSLSQLEAREEELNTQQQKLADLEGTINQLETTLQADSLPANKIIQTQNLKLARILTAIEKLVTESEVKLEQLAPQQQTKEDEVVKLPLELSITGDYQDIVQFLSGLEELNYLISFANLKFSSTQEILEAKLVVVVYAIEASDRNEE
ncbi:type 4a pilus biogenesis protein PilO [Halanaerobaculum tunisiense]